MQKITAFIQNRPWVAVGVAAAIGGVLALSFGVVGRILRPVAKIIPGSTA